MSELIASSEITAVVGMGATGMSVARYLAARGERFVVLDSRTKPPNLPRFRADFPEEPCQLGDLSAETLGQASRVVLSPGLSQDEPAVRAARQQGVPVLSDIQLFRDAAEGELVGITGSNGKSTVTALVGEMLAEAGCQVGVGGNLGPPALDLLSSEAAYYVLELSSFQLETTQRLGARVACVLNVSPDHMDRYPNLMAYHAAKQRIYLGAQAIVVNRDDPLTQPPLAADLSVTSFGAGPPDLKQFGLRERDGETWLARGLDCLMPLSALLLVGRHNAVNALAALAIGEQLQLPMDTMLATLRSFGGLPHRCQRLAERDGVEFINDSKATNPGATRAALEGLARQGGKIVLIAGGQGKATDFSVLSDCFAHHLRALIYLGEEGESIAALAAQRGIATRDGADMGRAVARAAKLAQPGDRVLLSPACASFDMYGNYRERGDHFATAVEEWLA